MVPRPFNKYNEPWSVAVLLYDEKAPKVEAESVFTCNFCPGFVVPMPTLLPNWKMLELDKDTFVPVAIGM